jgi:putative transposase
MKRSRFSEERIIGILKEQEAGVSVADLCRKHGVSDASIYKWKANSAGWRSRKKAADDAGRREHAAETASGYSWVATTAGISGEMVRDMMVQCVEQRFGDLRAPHRVQWLTDNGSIFAANRTLEIAAALNLEPCFTPVESPESNGMAEAFVKTFKRDYVRINPLPDARTALSRIDHWMEDYNFEHPHSRLGYRSPREYIASLQQAACPV